MKNEDTKEIAITEELAVMEPVPAEVMNQKTGQFESVMVSPQDIKKYICPTATMPELYIFMSICRHQGIDPISEAYFVKFNNQPGFTVMKYTVYLKRALKSGVLKSIRHEFDDEERPTKITVYIERTDLEGEWIWTTYMSEVEKNSPVWKAQKRFMLTKCGYSQALRFFCADAVGALPPVREEMQMSPPALGFKNFTPDQLAEHGVEPVELESEAAEFGEISATKHQIDMSSFHKSYFVALKARNFLQDETERQDWQEERVGKRHTGDWGPADYSKAMDSIYSSPRPPDPEPPTGAAQEAGAPVFDITSTTRKRIGDLLSELKIYDTPRSPKFKKRVEPTIGRWLVKMQCMTNDEGLAIIESLDTEKLAIEAEIKERGAQAGATAQAQEAEHTDEWFQSVQRQTVLEAYTVKAAERFADVTKSSAWHIEIGLPGSPRFWTQEQFGIAHDGLNALGVIDADAPKQPAAQDDISNGEGKCSDEQYEVIKEILTELLPGAKTSDGTNTVMGNAVARGWMSGILKTPFSGVRNMTTQEADDVILGLQDIRSTKMADALGRE